MSCFIEEYPAQAVVSVLGDMRQCDRNTFEKWLVMFRRVCLSVQQIVTEVLLCWIEFKAQNQVLSRI